MGIERIETVVESLTDQWGFLEKLEIHSRSFYILDTALISNDRSVSREEFESTGKVILKILQDFLKRYSMISRQRLWETIVESICAEYSLSSVTMTSNNNDVAFFYRPQDRIKAKDINREFLENCYPEVQFIYESDGKANRLRTWKIEAVHDEYFLASDYNGQFRNFRYEKIVDFWLNKVEQKQDPASLEYYSINVLPPSLFRQSFEVKKLQSELPLFSEFQKIT